MTERDPLLVLAHRHRRRLHPLVTFALVLVGLGAIVALWISAFAPVLISPQEFHARQKHLDRALRSLLQSHSGGVVPELPPWPGPLSADRLHVLGCAEAAIARAVRHASTSQNIDYPWGDIPPHLGTSADLVVRCLRSVDIDLQQLVHHDRKSDPKRYPTGMFARKTPDKSLDHRRVAFLHTFAKRFLPDAPIEHETVAQRAAFLPGDLVFWSAGGREGQPGLAGFVLDRRDESGMPMVATLTAEDGRTTGRHRLDTWPLLGHMSLDVDTLLERFLEAYPSHQQEARPPVQVTP
jgi:hypothetical protein